MGAATTAAAWAMTPLQALEALHVYEAACNLHGQLSEWAHAADPPTFIVRRMLVDRDDMTIDIVRPPTREIDRFIVSLNAERLTVTAGTLGVERRSRTWPRSSFELGDLQCWMRETVA